MKGVVFIGGEGPEAGLRRLFVRNAAVIAAADSGLYLAEEAGIKPDWIIGDMDSIIDRTALDRYPAGRVIRYPADKDESDTELACKLLASKGCTDITLIGGGGGRLAHLAAIFALFERSCRPTRWRTAREDTFLVTGSLSFTVKPDTIVSIFPVGDGPWQAASGNLKWPLDQVVWKRGVFGLSNIALSGSFQIKVSRGAFLVVIETDEYTDIILDRTV